MSKLIKVHEIVSDDEKYSEPFAKKMADIGVSLPQLGTSLSFRLTATGAMPINTIANAIRVGITDNIRVLCLNVDDDNVSKSNITTNSPYFMPHFFIKHVLNLIPIKQIVDQKYTIHVNNDTDGYRLITSADIKPNDGMFFDDYHIAILPPRTSLNVQNITPISGIGYLNGNGHTYATRVGWNVHEELRDYTITLTPLQIVNPKLIVPQVCTSYISEFEQMKNIINIHDEYIGQKFNIRHSDGITIYSCKNWNPAIGSVIESIGVMLDASPQTWITYNTIHNTIVEIEIRVRHTDAKKYMLSILDTAIDVYQAIRDSFII